MYKIIKHQNEKIACNMCGRAKKRKDLLASDIGHICKTCISGKQPRIKSNPQTYNGIWYQSKLEAEYAQTLDIRVYAKDIAGWTRQKGIELEIDGKGIGTKYYIDFIIEHNDGSIEYVECKGFETLLWRLKWKIFESMMDKRDDVTLTIVR